jgi:hypothetical protein
MLLGLIPGLGGDGTRYGVIAMNDTGSDVLTIFDVEMPLLGIYQLPLLRGTSGLYTLIRNRVLTYQVPRP